jgi:uncharacterized protein
MKKLFTGILATVLFTGLVPAKENPGAATYKTYATTDKKAPVVYFIKAITPESLVKVYQATG